MKDENTVIFALGGEIDHHKASSLRTELDDMIIQQRPKMLVFDFSNVSFMDSSGIGLVLGRYRLMNSLGGKTEIIGTTKNIRRLFEMSGVNKIIDIK